MLLGNRKTEILNFIVRDYIRHGLPVSSGRIHEKTDIEAAPATIRHIMGDLDEDGFLEQPHISGGRVPTDKAYRYFVDYLMETKELNEIKKMDGINSDMDGGNFENSDLFEEVNKTISEATKLFTLIADFSGKKQLNFYGFQRLLDEPEFGNDELLRSFAGLFDNLYEIADVYRRRISEETIFIGKENPLEETQMMSVMGKKIKNKTKRKDAVALIIGPRRMNYEYNYSILRYFLK